MAFPYTAHNSFRIYDHTVAQWVGSLKVDYGTVSGIPHPERGLLWVYGSPAKAFANMSSLLLRKGWVDDTSVGADGMTDEDWITVPLPFASITRQDPVFDPTRSRVPYKFRKFIREFNKYKAVRFPLPYDVTYQIDYWYKRKFTEAHIFEWILSQVSPIGAANNEFFLTADFGDIWGQKMIPAQQISLTDNSDLEPDEDGDRTLRSTFTMTLRAWVFLPVEEAKPMVLRVHTQAGPESYLEDGGFESEFDDHVHQEYDEIPYMLRNDPILFEMSGGTTQTGDKTWSIPSAGYIQTVDCPLFGEQDVNINLNLDWGTVLAGGLDVEVFDYNSIPVQTFNIGAGQTGVTDELLTVSPGTFLNAVRVRLAPSEAVSLTVDDINVGMAEYAVP